MNEICNIYIIWIVYIFSLLLQTIAYSHFRSINRIYSVVSGKHKKRQLYNRNLQNEIIMKKSKNRTNAADAANIFIRNLLCNISEELGGFSDP